MRYIAAGLVQRALCMRQTVAGKNAMGLRIGRFALVVGVLLTAGGCASGPSDFLKTADAPQQGPALRTSEQQAALTRSLSSTGARQSSASASISQTEVMALTVMRQQQTEEARALLAESGVATPTPACTPAQTAAAATNCAATP